MYEFGQWGTNGDKHEIFQCRFWMCEDEKEDEDRRKTSAQSADSFTRMILNYSIHMAGLLMSLQVEMRRDRREPVWY